jgi:choline dehydrogenase-like flavoprotein
MSDDQRVVVIGSGPAGAMAARELVGQGVPVTLLEAGTARPSGRLVRVAGRNVFRQMPEPASPPEDFVRTGHPETMWISNLALGGLSNQWTGAVPRFSPSDFTEGERIDVRYRWPIGYDDLASFYADAESVLQVTASPAEFAALPAGQPRYRRFLPRDWQPVARAAASLGQGLTVLPLADGPDWLVARRGTAFNSFSRIVQGLLASPLFELRTGAQALRLEWSKAGRRVESVLYHDRATGPQRVDAAAVVVAAGALRSTKLLFDSACDDFPAGLGNQEGVLGRYFHDHPKEWWVVETDRPLARLAPAAYLTRMPYDASAPLMATSWTIGNASFRDKVLSLAPTTSTQFGVQVFGTMRPTEDRFVRPHPELVDEFGLPQLELSIAFSTEEVDNVVASRERFLAVLAAAGVGAHIRPIEPQLVPGNAVHYGGTARMHASSRYGVVDEWNRVFGVPNVVVCDASSFTTNSEKNPTLTLMAIAARAARRLACDMKAG